MLKGESEALMLLRQLAERFVGPSPPAGDGDRALYELQIHQVELSMQCEELQRMQLELERSREEYRMLYEEAPVGYLTCTPAGRILQANATLANMLGAPGSDLVGTALPSFAAPVHRDAFYLHAVALREQDAASCEMQLVTTAGECRDVRLDSRAVRDGQGKTVQLRICVVDLTEQKRAHDRVRELTERSVRDLEESRSAALKAIGSLAGGIAHEFNNLLTGILSNIAMARSDPAAAGEGLAEAEAAARRAATLATRLLTFADGGAPVKRVMSIAPILVERARSSFRGSNATAHVELADDLWPIEGDPGQLDHVIGSLVANAADAMQDGGLVRVAADNVVLGDETAFLPSGNYALDRATSLPVWRTASVRDSLWAKERSLCANGPCLRALASRSRCCNAAARRRGSREAARGTATRRMSRRPAKRRASSCAIAGF